MRELPTSPAIRIGTSGWNYSHWRRLFYPPGLSQPQWLSFYAAHFDTVEINATFYRLPKAEYVDRWREAAPEGFIFAVKGSRYLTHMKRLADTGESLDRFFDLVRRLAGKAGPVLWQLPPGMGRDDDRLAAFAGALPGDVRHAFEFRNPEWYDAAVYGILERAGAALCIPDHPDYPQELILTTGWTYIRLHYGSLDGCYSKDELESWAGRITALTAQGADAYIYFNNDWNGHALDNAKALRGIIGAANGQASG